MNSPAAGAGAAGRNPDILEHQRVTWHPDFESAAHGGGLPIGAGYVTHVKGPYAPRQGRQLYARIPNKRS